MLCPVQVECQSRIEIFQIYLVIFVILKNKILFKALFVIYQLINASLIFHHLAYIPALKIVLVIK